MLLNLAGNAVKFTELGSVGIRARLEREEHGIQYLELAVTDTGIGISPGDQALLFQPFVQADDPGSRHRGGTGLGLAISRRLVELMNGEIGLESNPGVGTTVRVRLGLPVATLDTPLPKAEPTADHQAGAPAGDSRPVLVVDDNEFNRSVLVKQVATLGYAAEQAGDGEEALHRWRTHDYSLILADCQMPGMDGCAFTRAVRAEEVDRPARPRTPIVGWTANVMPEDVEACLAAGMDAVLAKPSALATVQSVLDTWVPAVQRPVPLVDVAPPSSPDAHVPIDHEQLRLIMNGDPRLEREMLDGFREAGARAVEALLGALSTAGPAAVRSDAHRLKGLARLVAAARLAAVCERIEEAARRGVLSDVAADAAELKEEWARLERYLEAVLA